jgi:hypothetical protein
MLAVADKNKDGRIPVEGIETLLRNIGASDRMSRAEIETILSEEGESHAKVIERGELETLQDLLGIPIVKSNQSLTSHHLSSPTFPPPFLFPTDHLMNLI